MAEGRRRSLADHLETLDTSRFVGRAAVLDAVDRLLAGRREARVLLVHGPGGIGKSALLRETRRRARVRGRPTWLIDARTIDPEPEALHRALGDARGREGAVVLVDSFERIGALVRQLQSQLLDQLAADALVVVAARGVPSPAWRRDGWEHIVTEIRLGPLTADEATALLAARGVTEPRTVGQLLRWAGGSPLALSIAATGIEADTGHAGSDSGPPRYGDLDKLIVRRLADHELGDVDAEVLEVAAVARAVDARLLTAVLPGRATRAAGEALRRSDVAELVGTRVTLHDLVRAALREDLRRRDPRRYGRLRCAIADHLLTQALHTGEARPLADMIELIDDPTLRWGIGGDAMTRVHVDPWDPDDLDDGDTLDDLVAAYVADAGGAAHWEALTPLLAAAPETGLVACDVAGRPVGFCVAMVAADAPAAAEADRHVAPLLDHARRHGDPARTIVFREAFQVVGRTAPSGLPASDPDSDSWTLGALTLAAVLRAGVTNVERSYIVMTHATAAAVGFVKAVGAIHHPDLDLYVDDRPVECWVVDHGPGGMLAQVRQVVYTEAGMALPDAAQANQEQLQAEALAAVRDFADHDALARNRLLPDDGTADPTARVAALRHLVTATLDVAFGRSDEDQLLRRVVELGDLDPETNHNRAMASLSLSRATYFRYLRRARASVARLLAEQAPTHPT